jgi:hypothetical protein
MSPPTVSFSVAPAIVYVSDQSRLHQLALSLFSWRRFSGGDVFVVDLGLTEAGRRWLAESCRVHLLSRLAPAMSLRHFGKDARRIDAYREKTRIGMHASWANFAERPLIYLDADIVVTEASFLDMVGNTPTNALSACPSVWDVDFNWTYKPEALMSLRMASGVADLALSDPMPNSGVTCARASTWAHLSRTWAAIYDAFLEITVESNVLRQGTLPGDQEFLALACRRCGVHWAHLHGSCNMQVDPRRMCWAQSADGHPMGGRFGEPKNLVRAVHFGCDTSGQLRLPPDALGIAASRTWLENEVAEVWAAACAAGLQSAFSAE